MAMASMAEAGRGSPRRWTRAPDRRLCPPSAISRRGCSFAGQISGASPMTIEVARRTVAREVDAPSGSPRDVRLACRGGAFAGQTSGLAPGHVQGNLAILPQELAADFLRFCHKNPKPC